MKRRHRFFSTFFLGIAQHIEGDAIMDVLLGADAVDRLLHLAMTTVPSLYGVGSRRKLLVIQKRQCLFQMGGLKLAQDFVDRLEASDTPAQLGQFRQGRVGAAAAIEQAVNFLHDVPHGSQRG
jgi:hypothetical protein